MLLFPCAQAQVTVVKQDGQKIYLDTSSYNRVVSVGDAFKIIISQEQLINPKTGKNLGLLNHYSVNGKIIEVQPLYAIGEMLNTTGVFVGQEAVIEQGKAAVPTVAATATPSVQNTIPVSNRKTKTYPAIDNEIISAVQADLTEQPGAEIATLDTKGNLTIYTINTDTLQEIIKTRLPIGYKPITLSAVDVMQSGLAQLFAVTYRENEQKISTLVFQTENQALKQITVLPYFAKELGCGTAKKIYAQKPFNNGIRPGNARVLTYEKEHFKLTGKALSTRGNWLSGVNEYNIQNKDVENFIYTASDGRLRMQLENGKFADSKDWFATAPNRIRYKQEMIVFYPSLQVYGPNGDAAIAAVENKPGWGILSDQFGQYKGSEVHFLVYENGSLKDTETLPLDGFLYDTNCTEHGIVAPQILPSGQTVLTEIYR